MAYKAKFLPLERLRNGLWEPLRPAELPGADD